MFSQARVKSLLETIDQDRLREIQRRYANSQQRYTKYAEVERWLKINLGRARDLRLDSEPRKQILDLGCGAGFFLFVAKQFSHVGLGLDVDDFPVSNELIDLFGVERLTWRIRAFQSLPDFGRKFDLITGFSTAFNRSEDESRGWTAEEWNFFLDDLDRYLKPGSEIFFEINSGKDKRYFPEEVRDLFIRRGAKVNGEFVRFRGKL
jgi:SAM-dependent methyltransferase